MFCLLCRGPRLLRARVLARTVLDCRHVANEGVVMECERWVVR